MEYYGCINRDDFNKLSEKQQQEFLLKEGLFSLYCDMPIHLDLSTGEQRIRKNLSELEKYLDPSSELKDSFYEFVLQKYQNYIRSSFCMFFDRFNKEVYGLDFQEQKKVGLCYSNSHYDEIRVDDVFNMYEKQTSENEVEQLKNVNRFELLHYQRRGAKDNLAERDLLMEFLFGNDTFFDVELVENNKVLNKVIHFESNLKILVSLNDRFHFEDDLYFSAMGILKEKYSRYEYMFISFDAFVFTHEKINSFNTSKQANIESLHAVLQTLELIHAKGTDFLNYVNTEHGMRMTKIRKHGILNNRTHDNRVRLFKADWLEFSSKK